MLGRSKLPVCPKKGFLGKTDLFFCLPFVPHPATPFKKVIRGDHEIYGCIILGHIGSICTFAPKTIFWEN